MSRRDAQCQSLIKIWLQEKVEETFIVGLTSWIRRGGNNEATFYGLVKALRFYGVTQLS